MIAAALSSAFAVASIEPTCACSRSSGSIDWRRILASKFMPPVVKPPARRISIIISVSSGTFMRELVGVPAQEVVAAVQVERAENAERGGELNLVLEGMAGEDRVVLLDD